MVCEAMACGRPILMSDVCDAGNLVRPGSNGFVFDPSSAEDMARALVDFAALSPPRRETMGRNSRAMAQRMFDPMTVAGRYAAILSAAAREGGMLCSTGCPRSRSRRIGPSLGGQADEPGGWRESLLADGARLKVLLVAPLPTQEVSGIGSWSGIVRREASGRTDVQLLHVDTAVRFRASTNLSLSARLVGGSIQALRDTLRTYRRLKSDRPDVLHLCTSASLSTLRIGASRGWPAGLAFPWRSTTTSAACRGSWPKGAESGD